MTEAREDNGVATVVIEPMGGLGNQLFIYAAGRDLAERCGGSMKLDLRWFQQSNDRRFELDAFPFTGRAERPESGGRASRSLGRRLFRRVPLGVKHDDASPAYVERSVGFDEAVTRLSAPVRIRGYFQSWRYFERTAPSLRQEIVQLLEPTEWYSQMRRTLRDDEPWIAVHIRRGDYTRQRIRKVHGLLPADYYRRGVAELLERIPGARIAMFSDAPDEARAVLGPSVSVDLVVQPPARSRPLESLLAMSWARGLCISNSSFSWWAAWVADTPNRPVVVPRPWFSSKPYVENDLVLPGWLIRGASDR